MSVTVRIATRDDAAAISRVRVESWRAAYAGLIDQATLDRLDAVVEAERRREGWDRYHADPRTADLVAQRDGEVIGWAAVGPAETAPADDTGADAPTDRTGQLFAMYVLPTSWGTGAGHALMRAAQQHLRDAGFSRAVLWVLDGNERAATFYEHHGWHEDGATLVDDRLVGGDPALALHERRRITTL